MPKKTVEFDEDWADELIADGTLTKEDVDRLMAGIIDIVTNWEDLDDDLKPKDNNEKH